LGILSGVVSYLFGLALNLLDAAINGFLGALGFDLDTFEHYFPAAADYHEVIVGFGVGLLLIMLVFQLFRNFGVMLDIEAEDPLKILGKTTLLLGMILYSRSIVNTLLGLLADPYAIFLNTASTPYEFKLVTLATAMFGSVFANPFMAIVTLILMLVLGWQFLKLTVECVERYIVFYFALYCAPVVFAAGAFKSTAQIFKSWCRMVASQAMLLLLNIWSIKLFLSFMPVFERDSSNMVFNFLMGYAFLKFAQKADTLLRILSLNTARTGDMVRSLGGTIAGIAMTRRTAGGMANHVTSAIGRRFGGTDAAGKKGGSPDGGGSGGSGASIGGMGSRSRPQAEGPSPGTGSAASGGVTASGISAAKQNFANAVFRAAYAQAGETPSISSLKGRIQTGKEKAQDEQENVQELNGDSIAMKPDSLPETTTGLHNLDEETVEGLSNLARGLPHDKFDAEKGSWSGGGFQEFTGEKANLIGASQLLPAKEVSQSMVKLPDGSTGTVYRNGETGSAHLVRFASVDNGVMQGTISQLDPKTGKPGEDFAFQAVHSSVPGAETFSAHAVPVAEPSGGAYHIATGADTTIFSSALAGTGTAYTPGGTSQMAASSRIAATDLPETTASQAANQVELFQTASNGVAASVSPQAPQPGGPPASPPGVETTLPGRPIEAPPPVPKPEPPQNQVRRFSRNNPANVEIFRRDGGQVESFDRPRPDQGSSPQVPPPKKDEKG
jgi:hypothetical protein